MMVSIVLNSRRRWGVTLLEVLVSMGVMSVGLLGVAALIPLGRMELTEATKLDNAATICRWAFRDLTVHGYLQPEVWVDPVSGEQAIRPVGGMPDPYSLVPTAKARLVNVNGLDAPPFAPIVIDPLMLAPRFFGNHTNTTSVDSREATQRQICRAFPYSVNLNGAAAGMPEQRGDAPKIARVSIRTYPADTFGPDPRQFIMRNDVASRFFKSNDDLIVQVPKDKSRRPVQVFTTSPSSNINVQPNDGFSQELRQDQVAFRKFRGDMSWFVVAEPSLAECYNPSQENAPAAAGPVGSVASCRSYRVWVVVCHQRDLSYVGDQSLADPKGIGERMVYVDFIDRNTARLRCGGLANEGAAMNALNVQSNQWFAVIGRYPEPVLGRDRLIMEWYRITGVSDRPTMVKDNMWYREVTIVGREFAGLGFSFRDEDGTTYPDMSLTLSGKVSEVQPMTGIGVIVQGARGVYEKSIYVDRPSLWSIRY